MPTPPLLTLSLESDYREYFINKYCKSPVITHDTISIRFKVNIFDHAFFENNDQSFSFRRATRMDWIEDALTNSCYPSYHGWDNKKMVYLKKRRVTLYDNNFLVVTEVFNNGIRGEFITAYTANQNKINMIRSKSPLWRSI